MNLHNLASGLITSVNPNITVTIKVSSGYTTNADGSRTPAYATQVTAQSQVQPLTSNEVIQVSGLNLQGENRAFYLTGSFEDLSRVTQQGGDLITLPDGSVWLTVQTLENWILSNGWLKIVAVQQNGA